MSAHVDVKPEYKANQAGVLRDIEELLLKRYHISHTTLQVECTMCIETPLIKELRHRPRKEHYDHDHDHSHKHEHDH
jgi:cobalt-zinc-cadmium efflux system protein